MALFDELLVKIAQGERLTPGELEDLQQAARRLEQAESLFSSLIQPGTNTLIVSGLRVAGGDVIADDKGLFLKNSGDTAWLNFADSQGRRGTVNIAVDPNDDLEFVNLAGDGTMSWFLGTFSDRVRAMRLEYDTDDGTILHVEGPSGAEARFKLGQNPQIELRTEGSSSGSTFMRMVETSNTPPGGLDDAYHMYMKDDKLIIQFNALDTAHYFYLDLTATSNQSWIYSATAP